MGKFFAAVIIVLLLGWLVPMCSQLPADLTQVSIPAATPSVTPAPAPAPMPELTPEPAAPKPAVMPAEERPTLTVTTYRSRMMPPTRDDKYIVSVLRKNKAAVAVVNVTMTLSSHMKGNVVERSVSGPGSTLEAGTTAYYGLTVSTVVFDAIIDGPEEPGTELEWNLRYRFEDDAPGTTRCFQLRALPRRLEPAGITWIRRGESRTCAPGGR